MRVGFLGCFLGSDVQSASRGLTTDQKVGGSSPSGRAAETLAPQGFRRVWGEFGRDSFWLVSWSTQKLWALGALEDRRLRVTLSVLHAVRQGVSIAVLTSDDGFGHDAGRIGLR